MNKQISVQKQMYILIFTLSHSRSAVEKGFSINKDFLVKNFQETSLNGQHTVYNHLIESKQEILKFKIAQDLIKSGKLTDSWHLDDQKEQAVPDKKAEKMKSINEGINDIKKRKWSFRLT